MPSFRCLHPTCANYLPTKGYCPDHAGQAQPSRHKLYDERQRDRESKRFYDSAAWSGPHGARAAALARQPFCSLCGNVATIVHHHIEVRQDVSKRLDPDNLICVCKSCHATIHAARGTDVH
jgi:5-methylcytosine-specific restriction protein A